MKIRPTLGLRICSYLIKVQELIPDGLVDHGAAVLCGNHDPAKFSGPGQSGRLEFGVVHLEVVLDNAAFCLRFTVRRGEEILGVVVVDHLLEAGGAQGREEQRHDDKVARMFADEKAELVEPAFERGVDQLVLLALHFGKKHFGGDLS